MPFSSLGLRAGLVEAIRDLEYQAPTPIQAQAIPLAMAGRDLVGCAQTGTGKTAAFILPLLHRLSTRKGIAALVVTPTRELARQIEDVARSCARYTKHRVTAVYGGVGYQQQVDALRRGVDLLVATPGRLLDLHARGNVDLRRVEVLVLDEADRMLDMGFWPDVKRIISLLPEERQNLLFSATLSGAVMRVAQPILRDPARVDVAPSATPVETVTQVVYPVNGFQKTDLLIRLLEEHRLERVLVFTRTKHRADRLCRHLANSGIRGAAIHSNRSQTQRQAALDGFKRGDYRVLVATDIVARGIDVDGISHVVNYDLPANPDDYIHRIGRTARAGAEGTALSFLAAEETKELREIEVLLGTPLECKDLDGFNYLERVLPNPERTATRKPRTVYRGRSARSRGSRKVYRGAGWGS